MALIFKQGEGVHLSTGEKMKLKHDVIISVGVGTLGYWTYKPGTCVAMITHASESEVAEIKAYVFDKTGTMPEICWPTNIKSPTKTTSQEFPETELEPTEPIYDVESKGIFDE